MLVSRLPTVVLASLMAMLVNAAATPAALARASSPLPFLAGAGQADTTPPWSGSVVGHAVDAQFGPSAAGCGAAFPNPGRFALEEPFSGPGGSWDSSELFCDANGNGHWDGLYADNGRGPMTGVHDPIDVRAFAVADGHGVPVVYATVDQIGLFDFYTERARQDLADTYHVNAQLVVSADHNESSPDSIGLYGVPQTGLGVGLRSGIDEYYMRFLSDRIALAAARAVHALRPAKLLAVQTERRLPDGAAGETYPLLRGLSQHISDQFPTAVALPHDDRIAAVDPKLGVLQARDGRGRPIFTVMSVAAHNQEMGNAGMGISADWPGAFERAFDRTHFGLAIFLVGDNGSEEDPQTNPPVVPKGSENHHGQATQYVQARATGGAFAAVVTAAVQRAQPLAAGPVRLVRRQLCVPLENNGFVALAAAGVFGLRQGYVCDSGGHPVSAIPNGSVLPTTSVEFRTFVGYADIGPDLQLLDNPGEAFPALMLGSPFTAADESCAAANPAVPTWYARALYRFQVGLADDLIGYEIPPWGFASGTPGLFTPNVCADDLHGHRHKLESESVGPTGSADVADALTTMLAAEPDPAAHVDRGRFVRADGSLSSWPTGAVGIALAPSAGRQQLIGAPGTAAFGVRPVDATGLFMDYDGQPQPAPDLTTRGMIVLDARGCVSSRFYVDVFPPVALSPPGRAVVGRAKLPALRCRREPHGATGIQPLAAAGAGLRRPSAGLRRSSRGRR